MQEIEEDEEENKEEKPQGMRRTASFTNVLIQEAAESDEEEKTSENGKNQTNESSPNDNQKKLTKRHLRARDIDRLKRSMGLGALGSKGRMANRMLDNKDTAHDEDFFHYFVSYLDEAITKVKV